MEPVEVRVCHICGKTYERAMFRKGRPKEGHRECLDLASRLAQVQDLLNRIEFEPEQARVMAGDLFAMRNSVMKTKKKQGTPATPQASCENPQDPFCDCDFCTNQEVS